MLRGNCNKYDLYQCGLREVKDERYGWCIDKVIDTKLQYMIRKIITFVKREFFCL